MYLSFSVICKGSFPSTSNCENLAMIKDWRLLDEYAEVPHQFIFYPSFNFICCKVPICRKSDLSRFLYYTHPWEFRVLELKSRTGYPATPCILPWPCPTSRLTAWATVSSSTTSISFSFSILHLCQPPGTLPSFWQYQAPWLCGGYFGWYPWTQYTCLEYISPGWQDWWPLYWDHQSFDHAADPIPGVLEGATVVFEQHLSFLVYFWWPWNLRRTPGMASSRKMNAPVTSFTSAPHIRKLILGSASHTVKILSNIIQSFDSILQEYCMWTAGLHLSYASFGVWSVMMGKLGRRGFSFLDDVYIACRSRYTLITN